MLNRDGFEAARKCAAGFHQGEFYRLVDYGICRSLTEHLAGSFGRHLVGSVFWYLLLGLPGLLLYSTILATSCRLEGGKEKRDSFGWLADRLEEVLAWLPGWTAGQTIVRAGVFPRRHGPSPHTA